MPFWHFKSQFEQYNFPFWRFKSQKCFMKCETPILARKLHFWVQMPGFDILQPAFSVYEIDPMLL